ncbi:MFS transporter, DHA2 family, multidrug resistance protein [Frankia sp. AiPs1]|uniref:DHA2 family efflux MFS transporter permease subunit n=1 Tax=Frankia sp. AiPa1 TaxID=573492 RepID=UPI00202B30E3|nr:DHA2 family efflux MFS transporter permease subunit [Frankia sp. AiPa1]MCL9759470.1 DHA2 family efflux MFS transporter permease subunit [Frankia sp. AiPa1]
MAQGQDDRLDPALLRLIGVLLLGGLMGLLDGTIVNVGIDTLGKHFDAPLSTVGWVATGYLLAVTVAIPLSGWAVDRFGTRRIWLSGLSLFLAGSLACGLAPSIGALVVFRVIQGFGGGMLDPVMLTLLARAAGPARVGRVMGLMGIVIPLGPVLGPIVGGVIIEHLSWRWMFLVNLPIGLTALAASLKVVPVDAPDPGQSTARLDTVGVSLLCPGFAVLVYALSQAGEHGFGAVRVPVTLAIGGVLLLAYIGHALRVREAALIDLRLFASRGFSASVAVMAVTGVMLFSMLFVVPLYYQQLRGHDVLGAGLLLAPLGVGSFIAMPLAGRLSDRVGARVLAPGGAALIAVSALVFTRSGTDTSEALLGVAAFVTGLGLGFIGAPTMGALYRTLPPASVPQGTSALYVLNQLGASLGIAIVAFILQRGISGGVPSVHAFQSAFWWVLGGAIAVLLSGLFLPGRPQPAPQPDAEQRESEPAAATG